MLTVIQTFALIFVLVIVLLIAEIHHRVTVMFMAVLLTIYFGVQHGLFSLEQVYSFIDHEVVLFILGIFILFESLAKSGLFEFFSYKLFSFAGSTPRKAYFLLALLTFILSVLVSNITAITIIGGLTIYIYREIGIDLEKALIAEGVVTNIGGLVLPISSIPNVIVSSTMKMGFIDFLVVSIPISLILFTLSLLLTFKITETSSCVNVLTWKKHLEGEKRPSYRALLVFVSFLLLLSLNEKLGIPPYLIAMSLATIMMWFSGVDPRQLFKTINWETVFFISTFYIFVEGLRVSGVLELIIQSMQPLLSPAAFLSVATLTLISGFVSALIDNIPVTLILLPVTSRSVNPIPLDWAIIIGGNLGGNFTTFGSPSTLIATSMLKDETGSVSQVSFLKVAVLPNLIYITVSSLYLSILTLLGFI